MDTIPEWCTSRPGSGPLVFPAGGQVSWATIVAFVLFLAADLALVLAAVMSFLAYGLLLTGGSNPARFSDSPAPSIPQLKAAEADAWYFATELAFWVGQRRAQDLFLARRFVVLALVVAVLATPFLGVARSEPQPMPTPSPSGTKRATSPTPATTKNSHAKPPSPAESESLPDGLGGRLEQELEHRFTRPAYEIDWECPVQILNPEEPGEVLKDVAIDSAREALARLGGSNWRWELVIAATSGTRMPYCAKT